MDMLPRSRQVGLQTRWVGDQLVVYDEQRRQLHVLNRPAALVWQYSNGERTVPELAALLGRELNAAVDESVIWLALADLDEARLLADPDAASTLLGGMTRRTLFQRAAAVAAAAMLPTVASVGTQAAQHTPGATTGAPGAEPPVLPAEPPTTTAPIFAGLQNLQAQGEDAGAAERVVFAQVETTEPPVLPQSHLTPTTTTPRLTRSQRLRLPAERERFGGRGARLRPGPPLTFGTSFTGRPLGAAPEPIGGSGSNRR